jgi:hypothetical protein
MVYHGRVRDGTIVLDPGIELPDGAAVRVELELPGEPPPPVTGDDPLLRMAELATETGISDLATNVDHYLYGHPKASDAG